MEQYHDIKQLLFHNTVGYILWVGTGLLLLFGTWLALGSYWAPEASKEVISLTLTRLVVGRPGGVYFGYVLGLGHGAIFSINFLVDAIAVFLLYPIFVLSCNRVLESSSLQKMVQHSFKMAEKSQSIVQKYGKIGLFAFVLFPLWGTGPVVGSAIGILMGLKHKMNMIIVLGATGASILCWMLIFSGFHQWLLSYNASAPIYVIGSLFLCAIGFHVYHWIRKDK